MITGKLESFTILAKGLPKTHPLYNRTHSAVIFTYIRLHPDHIESYCTFYGYMKTMYLVLCSSECYLLCIYIANNTRMVGQS